MASLTIAMVIEGVLAGRDDDVELSQSLCEPLGQSLYVAFARSARLILLTALERRLADHWLRMNSLQQHAGIYPLDERAIRRLRAAGETPDLYVDHFSERVAEAVREGVPTMLFVRPLYARAGFQRTDLPGLQRPWAAVVGEQAAQREQRARPVFDPDND